MMKMENKKKQILLTLQASRGFTDPKKGFAIESPIKGVGYFLFDDEEAINSIFKEFEKMMKSRKKIHARNTIFK